MINKTPNRKYVVLYDGYCIFCGRARRFIEIFDWCKQIDTVNLYDEKTVSRLSMETPALEDLARAVHLIRSDGKIYKGFYACRKIGILLPITFLPSLFLYIPGVPYFGEKVYAFIERVRK
jgi:predicted DCC family thiol-disulfide oxidoreductase YuxK